MSQTKSNPVATITENNISIYMNGVLYPPINKTHVNFEKIKTAIKDKNWSVVPDLIEIAKVVKRFLSKNSSVTLENGVVSYKGKPLHNHITKRILSLIEEGFDFIPLLNFIENLHLNPSNRAVNELYSFLEHFALPITEDGHFLAYKAVRNDYKDIYSGTFDNSVGKTPTVDRNTVDEDFNRHCSHGLHVGAITYVTQYGGFSHGLSAGGNKLMIVKVNPADAVCVPGDHNCTKLRVCKYEVIGEIFNVENILKKAVYTSNGEESKAYSTTQSYGEDDPTDDYPCEDCEDFDDGCFDSCSCDSDDSDDNSTIDRVNGIADGENDANLGFPYECPGSGSDEYDEGYKSAYVRLGLV